MNFSVFKNMGYYAALILVCVTGSVFGKGLYDFSKTQLSQYLIERSWEQSLSHNTATKPWPWADVWPVARIIVPRRDVDIIILSSDGGKNLSHADSPPSKSVNPGISEISVNQIQEFEFVANLRPKDEILFQNNRGDIQKFTVSHAQIFHNGNYERLTAYSNAFLSLEIPYPSDSTLLSGSLRYVVFAEKVKNYSI